jgi:hypothetical protein
MRRTRVSVCFGATAGEVYLEHINIIKKSICISTMSWFKILWDNKRRGIYYLEFEVIHRLSV